MNLKKTIIVFIMGCLLLLAACMNQKGNYSLEPPKDQPLELTKLSSGGKHEQQAANQAKEILSNYGEVSEVRAVNHNNHLLVAVDVPQHERFQLDKIENTLRDKINKNFSEINVTLSTDQKLLIELEQLEKDIQEDKVSKEDVKKRLKKLKELSQENT